MRIKVQNLQKQFVLHNQNEALIPVFSNLSLQVEEGECVVLTGSSGSGKSTLLRTLYGNYLPDSGEIIFEDKDDFHLDIVSAHPRDLIYLRIHKIGWVSQFLRTIPRVSSLDLVMQPALKVGMDENQAKKKATDLLSRLNIPENLWMISPTTFSGGEQQRVNIARGFMVDYPCLLLDEPTASLDEKNKEIVLELINEAKNRGCAIVGIFHDEAAKESVMTKDFPLRSFK